MAYRLRCAAVGIENTVASLGTRGNGVPSEKTDGNSVRGVGNTKIVHLVEGLEFDPFTEVQSSNGSKDELSDGWLLWRVEAFYPYNYDFEYEGQLNGNQGSWTNSDDVKSKGNKQKSQSAGSEQAERARRHKESVNHQKKRHVAESARPSGVDDALKQLDAVKVARDPSFDKRTRSRPPPTYEESQNVENARVPKEVAKAPLCAPEVAEPKVARVDFKTTHKPPKYPGFTCGAKSERPRIVFGCKESASEKPSAIDLLPPTLDGGSRVLRRVYLYVMPSLYGKSTFMRSPRFSKYQFIDVDDMIVDDDVRKDLRNRACSSSGWDADEAWREHNKYAYARLVLHLGSMLDGNVVILCHSNLRLVHPIVADLIPERNVLHAPFLEDDVLEGRAAGDAERLRIAVLNNRQHRLDTTREGNLVTSLDIFMDEQAACLSENQDLEPKKLNKHQVRRLAARSEARAAIRERATPDPVPVDPALLSVDSVLHGPYLETYNSTSDPWEAKKYLDSVREGAFTYAVMDYVRPKPPDPHIATVEKVAAILELNNVEADPDVVLGNLYRRQTQWMASLRVKIIEEMKPLCEEKLSYEDEVISYFNDVENEKRTKFLNESAIKALAVRHVLTWEGPFASYDAVLHNTTAFHHGTSRVNWRAQMKMVTFGLLLRGTNGRLNHIERVETPFKPTSKCGSFKLESRHVDFAKLFAFDENSQPKHAACVRRLKSYFDYKALGVSSSFGKIVLRDKEESFSIIHPPRASQVIDPLCKQMTWLNVKTKKPLKLELREIPSLSPKNSFGKSSGFARFRVRCKYAMHTLTRRFLLRCAPFFTHDVNTRRSMLQNEVAPLFLANHDVAFWDGTRSSVLGYTGYQKNVLVERDLCDALIDAFVASTAFNNDLVSRMNHAANKWLREFTNWEPGEVELLNNCVRFTFVTLQLNRFAQSETLKITDKATPLS